MEHATPVTRDVSPDDVVDLALAPPRAHLAFADGTRARVLPVRVQRVAGADLVGVPAGAPGLAGREVHLVRDDGRFWFQLRALTVRGILEPTDAAPDASPSLRWYRLTPSRTVAWDYGRLREDTDA